MFLIGIEVSTSAVLQRFNHHSVSFCSTSAKTQLGFACKNFATFTMEGTRVAHFGACIRGNRSLHSLGLPLESQEMLLRPSPASPLTTDKNSRPVPDWRRIAETAAKERNNKKLIRLVRALCDQLEELQQTERRGS